MRFRLLPITIGVVGLLLASKTMSLTFALLPTGWALSEVALPIAIAAFAAEPAHGEAASQKVAAAHAPPPQIAPVEPPPTAKSAVPSEPPTPPISAQERQLLQELRDRRRGLETRERLLTEREDVLKAAEQRLIARHGELAALQSKLEQLDHSRADRDEANWLGLVKMYEAMKPREAAAIFNDMDGPILLELIDRMKETKASAILATMQPDRARLATSQLAAKRSRTATLDRADHVTAEGTPHS